MPLAMLAIYVSDLLEERFYPVLARDMGADHAHLLVTVLVVTMWFLLALSLSIRKP